MAPKKSLLLITAIILTTGLATAQNSFEESPQEEVWLNSDSQIDFLVSYSSSCDSNSRAVIEDSGDNTVKEFPKDQEYEEKDGDGNLQGYRYDYEFGSTGTYDVRILCESTQNGNTKILEAGPETVNVGDLELSLLNISDENVVYEGDSLMGGVEVETNNDENLDPQLDFKYRFDNQDFQALTLNGDNGFDIDASDSSYEALEVKAVHSDFEETASQKVNIQEVWQVDGLEIRNGKQRDEIKYRNFGDVEIAFNILRKGEPYKTLSSDEFTFNPEDGGFENDRGNNWFNLNYNSGEYQLNFHTSPSIIENGRAVRNYEIELDTDIDSSNVNIPVHNLEVEKDVDFSGSVRDLGRNRVPTSFTAYFNSGFSEFSTGDSSASFQRYFTSETADRMVMEFPEARFELSNFEFVRQYPAGQEEEIRYNYYSNFGVGGLSSSVLPQGVRPVNLVSVESDYDYEANPDVSRATIQFDSSKVEDIREIVVYECDYWMFERETCSTSWSEKDVRPLGQGTVSVEINPYDEQFGGTSNVLWNSYLVGVPKGVGEGLTLDSSLDVSSRVKSGEEFSVSGRVISDSTGESVEGADVSLTLSSEENEIELEEVETDSNGNFELSTVIEEGGSYSVELDASKNPYDSLSVTSNSTIDIYYETGLSVSAESDPEVTLGEPYDIDYTVENIGQAPAEDIELSVSGVDSDEYDLVPQSIDSIEAGESSDVVLTLDLSEDLVRPPTINFEASGTSSGKDVRGSATTSVSFAEGVNTESSDTDESEGDQDQEDTQDSQSSSSLPNVEDVTRATGEFVQSQSDMNLALGLILVFGVVLAAAVRKRKEGGGDRRGGNDRMGRMGGQGRVQKPDVSPTKVETDEPEEQEGSEEEDDSEEESGEESSGGSDGSEIVCDTCGESFDTESGLNLHRQALH